MKFEEKMTEQERNNMLDFLERNINFFWLLMDGLWMWGLKLIPTLLVFPTIVITVVFFIYSAKTPMILVGIIVGSSWMLLDIFWMISEFYEVAWIYTLSRVMFLIAVLFMIYESVGNKSYRDSASRAISQFRKFPSIRR